MTAVTGQSLTKQRAQRASARQKAIAANLKGLAFVVPWLVGFLTFTIYPIAASLYYSFHRYDAMRKPKYIGFENYVELFTTDTVFKLVIGNTLYFVVIGVPLAVVSAYLLASLLNNEIKFRPLFRTIFFIPSIVPSVASAMVWMWVLNIQFGAINASLASIGVAAIPFLSSPQLAKPSLIMIHCWTQGSAIVIFLAALQDVPRSLYDAALVDGAGPWARFWHVTIPMCTPAILFVLITGLIGSFQYFTFPWLLTEGGPNRSTEFFGVYLYRNAFNLFKMGYASALAWILFVLIIVFTIMILRSSARWVYYGGASD